MLLPPFVKRMDKINYWISLILCTQKHIKNNKLYCEKLPYANTCWQKDFAVKIPDLHLLPQLVGLVSSETIKREVRWKSGAIPVAVKPYWEILNCIATVSKNGKVIKKGPSQKTCQFHKQHSCFRVKGRDDKAHRYLLYYFPEAVTKKI